MSRSDRARAELAGRRRDGAAGAGGGAPRVRGADAHPSPRRPRIAPLFDESTPARAGRDPRRSIATAKSAQLRAARARRAAAAAQLVRQRVDRQAQPAFRSAGAIARVRPGPAAHARRRRGRRAPSTRSSTTSPSSAAWASTRPTGERPAARCGPRPRRAPEADALLAGAGVEPGARHRRLRAGRGLRAGEAMAAGSRRAGHRGARARRASSRCCVGARADRETARAIESSLPPGTRVVDLIGRTSLRRARRRDGAVRRVRVERLGRDARRRGAGRAGDRDLRADRRAGDGAGRARPT